jgi:hypothetical protein
VRAESEDRRAQSALELLAPMPHGSGNLGHVRR